MSDINASLPIRTEDNEQVVIRLVDGVNTNDFIKINPDGSINSNVTATNLDVRDLVFSTDKVDVTGSEVSLDSATLSALENITVSATDLDIRELTFASDKVDVTGSEISFISGSKIKITDGTDDLAINSDGSINVLVQEDSGLEVINYNSGSDITPNGTSAHEWTSAAASKLQQVLASASGRLKIEIQIETASGSGIYNTVTVAFNSSANPNIDICLKKYAAVSNGAKVRVIRTNLDKAAQDVYSTIIALQG